MVKEQFQKELLEKVKPGTKPSHLKKLKRSKSAGDIPKAPPSPTSVPLTKSKSSQPSTEIKYPYTTLISQQQELARLQKETTAKSDTIKLLRKKIEELEKNNPPSQLLSDQLETKQKEIENLRKQLETNPHPTDLTELDNSLFARHKNLKDWFISYQEKKKLDSELSENINEASTELLEQDKVISQLRGQISKLKNEKASLVRDLQLVSRLAESRKVPYFANESNWDYLKYALYSLVAVVFTVWLVKSFKNIRESPNYD